MKFRYKMPDLSETGSEYEVMAWLAEEGSLVEADATLLEVATDKATIAVPAPATARLLRRLVEVGATIRAGTPVAELEPAT